MDSAVAGAVDLGRYGRRIVRMIWDPEPTNNPASNRPVWCLGCEYTLEPGNRPSRASSQAKRAPVDDNPVAAQTASTPPATDPPEVPPKPPQTGPAPATPPESVSSSFDSSLAYDDVPDDGGWPPAFLDDFESRIWVSYRSGFPPIPRSTDPAATSRMSFAMRLKTMTDQQAAFTTDSGWGCMIRTGQSLLANTLLSQRLGRGKPSQSPLSRRV